MYDPSPALLGKTPAILRLLFVLEERFGPGAFPVEDLREASPDGIGLISAEDARVYFSIITTDQPEGCYSVMIYTPRAEGDECIIPYYIAADRACVGLDELLDLFAQFRRC